MMKRPNPSVLISHDLLYKIYTTYQFTYFIDVCNQDVTKDQKITLIRYLHQKIHTKYDCNIENNVYLR